MSKKKKQWTVVNVDRLSKVNSTHTKRMTFYQTNSDKQMEKSEPSGFESSTFVMAKFESCHNSLGFAGHFISKVMLDTLKNKQTAEFSQPSNSNIDSNCKDRHLNSEAPLPGKPTGNSFGPNEDFFIMTRQSAVSDEPTSPPRQRYQPNSLGSSVEPTAGDYNRITCIDGLSRKSESSEEGEQSLRINSLDPASTGLRPTDPSPQSLLAPAQGRQARPESTDPPL